MITLVSRSSTISGTGSLFKVGYSDIASESDILVTEEAASVDGSVALATGSAEVGASCVISSGSTSSDFKKETETSTLSASVGIVVVSLFELASTSSELAGSSSVPASSPVNGDKSQSIMDFSLTSDIFSSVT